MNSQPRIELNDGRSIPQVGLGVFQTPDDVIGSVVQGALVAGYRQLDTAAIYKNERGVGEGIQASVVAREEIFITTKLWGTSHGFDATLRAFDESLQRLGLDYLDLYLIHWPSPQRNLYVETWQAFVRLRKEGRIRSIGVSNFEAEHLRRIIEETGVVPALNQIELHPRLQQRALRELHGQLGIATQSWSPLGQGKLLSDATIGSLATKHGRTPAQIIIRWHLDSGLIAIPKSASPGRIIENFDVFGFRLDESDMTAIARLDAADGRIGPHPLKAPY
jgi:2,5-diketo-D-gluconate reductase A